MDIIKGLEYIHYTEIIHQDLHSKNILLEGFLKISDLGLSKSSTELAMVMKFMELFHILLQRFFREKIYCGIRYI